MKFSASDDAYRRWLLAIETLRRQRAGLVWTPERVETLKRLWHEGKSCLPISKILGVSESAVRNKASHLKLKRPKYRVMTAEKEASLRELWPSDIPKVEICRMLDISRGAVDHAVKRLKLRARTDGRKGPTGPRSVEEKWTRALRGQRYEDVRFRA